MKTMHKSSLHIAAATLLALLCIQPAQAEGKFWVEYNFLSEVTEFRNDNPDTMDVDESDDEIDGNGVNLGIAVNITKSLYAFGQYDAAKFDEMGENFSFQQVSGGVGIAGNPENRFSYFGAVSLEYLDLDEFVGDNFTAPREGEIGYGIRFGAQVNIANWVWVGAEYVLIDVNDVDAQYAIGRVRVRATDFLRVYAKARLGDYDDGNSSIDRHGYSAGIEFLFGGDDF